MLPVVNLNGNLISKATPFFGFDHAAIQGGEIIVEEMRLLDGEFLFAEKHYFHLMANMRMARMMIPMQFTPDFFYAELQKLRDELAVENAVFLFQVSQNFQEIDFWITARVLPAKFHFIDNYEIDQYRETHVANGFHQRVHFPEPRRRMLRTFALENELNDLLLLNESKAVAKTTEGNIFIVTGNNITTPPIEDGADDNVLRDSILQACKTAPFFDEVREESVFPFALTKADEIFVAKNGEGIYSVSQFRKRVFSSEITAQFTDYLLGN